MNLENHFCVFYYFKEPFCLLFSLIKLLLKDLRSPRRMKIFNHIMGTKQSVISVIENINFPRERVPEHRAACSSYELLVIGLGSVP